MVKLNPFQTALRLDVYTVQYRPQSDIHKQCKVNKAKPKTSATSYGVN